jgi:hypothetical protein
MTPSGIFTAVGRERERAVIAEGRAIALDRY